MENKRIPGYSRYFMNSDGVITNAQTGKEMTAELRGEFPDVVPYVRLTADNGSRVRVAKPELYNLAFPNKCIEDEVQAESGETEDKQPSKSQQIWLMHRAGVTITQMSKKGYNRRHAYNVIKRDYADNKELQRRAESSFIYQNGEFKCAK